MQYQPHRKLKPLLTVCFLLLTVSLCFLALSNLGWGFLWLNQLGTVLFITLLIYLLIRYAMTDFVYQLPEEANRLTVKKISGSFPRTVAEIVLSPADRLIPFDREARRREGILHIENYCASLFPQESYLYITQLEGKTIALRLECREDVANRIRDRIAALPPSCNASEEDE